MEENWEKKKSGAGWCSPDTFDGKKELEGFFSYFYEAWSLQMGKEGKKTDERAFKVREVELVAEDKSGKALADYAAKLAILPAYMVKSVKAKKEGWQLNEEDEWRSLSPWDLLDKYKKDGDPRDYAGAWIEYCQATKGFHRVDWSSGLEARFGVRPVSEEAECRHVLPGPVADVAFRDWAYMRKLKAALLSGRKEEVVAALEDYSLEDYAEDVLKARPVYSSMTDAARELARRRQEKERAAESYEKKNEEARAALEERKARGVDYGTRLAKEKAAREAAEAAERAREAAELARAGREPEKAREAENEAREAEKAAEKARGLSVDDRKRTREEKARVRQDEQWAAALEAIRAAALQEGDGDE